MKTQEQKDITCKKIAWTIRNFSSLKTNDRHYSKVFIAGDCAWRLAIYRGKTNNASLAISLIGADASLAQGGSIITAFSLTVVNQVSRKQSVTKGVADRTVTFRENSGDWGYNIFMPLGELENPYGGYILNDKCIIEVELFSVTFEEGIEPTSRSKDDDVVEFKDLRKTEKAFVPLLEEVCSWHPSVLEYCTKNKSLRFTEWAFSALGRVLLFLKTKKWKDMNEEACERLQHLWEELEISRLDLTWLEPTVKSVLKMRGYKEKAEKVKKLKENLLALEIEMNMTKEKLDGAKQSVEMITKELVNAEQDFEEKDLDAKIEYEKP